MRGYKYKGERGLGRKKKFSSTCLNIAISLISHLMKRRLTTGDAKCIETTSQMMGNSNLNTTRRFLHLVLGDHVESMLVSTKLAKVIK